MKGLDDLCEGKITVLGVLHIIIMSVILGAFLGAVWNTIDSELRGNIANDNAETKMIAGIVIGFSVNIILNYRRVLLAKKKEVLKETEKYINNVHNGLALYMNPHIETEGAEKIRQLANSITGKWYGECSNQVSKMAEKYEKCSAINKNLQSQIVSFEGEIDQITRSLN